MKSTKKKQFNSRNISKVMAIILSIMLIAPNWAHAGTAANVGGQYPLAYDKESKDNDFYLWHKVKDGASRPIYEYLSDYNANIDDYRSGKKQFRVMFLNHYIRNNAMTDSIGSVDGKYRPVMLTHYYEYDTYLMFPADWTRIYRALAYNFMMDSAVPVADNIQVNPKSDQFITRGAQRSFICDYAGKWTKDTKNSIKKADKFTTEYQNADRYHFYFPDISDRRPDRTLYYCEGNYTSNFFAYDSGGNPWAYDSSFDSDDTREWFQTKGETALDTWALIKGEKKDQVRILSYDRNGDDYFLEVSENADLQLQKPDEYHKEPYNWELYVGEPCPAYLMDDLNESNKASLSSGNVRTIKTPEFIRKDYEFTIEEGAVLFVDSLLAVNGTIINKGTIVIGGEGAILSWNQNAGVLNNDGGDIIIRKNGVFFVDQVIAKNHTMILSSNLAGRKFDLNNVFIELKNFANAGGMLYDTDWLKTMEVFTIDNVNGVLTPKVHSDKIRYRDNSSSTELKKNNVTLIFGDHEQKF